MKKLILAVFLGSVVAQIWGTISWVALPWHMMEFKQFGNEEVVANAIRQETPAPGLYTLPNMDPTVHENDKAMTAWNTKLEKGPFAFMAIVPAGIEAGMGKAMGIGLALNIIISGFLLFLMKNVKSQSIPRQALFAGICGMLGSIYPHMSNWNWWHFPFSYCLIGVVDLFITWYLAGMAMAFITRNKGDISAGV